MGFLDMIGMGGKKEEVAAVPEVKKTPNCKICCACPSTRAARDECILLKGEEACMDFIEAHYTCLLGEGFSQDQVNKLRERSVRK